MCVAFRPQYFDALRLAQLRLFENTALLLEQRNGYLFGDDTVFTWQSSAEIRNLIERELHMQLLHLVGIGCCSGIAGDPHELIARPSRLAQAAAALPRRVSEGHVWGTVPGQWPEGRRRGTVPWTVAERA